VIPAESKTAIEPARGSALPVFLVFLTMGAGLLIPTLMGLSTFPVFLVTVLALGAGATILQVAGNPIMRDVSAGGKYARNLSLGQFVKASSSPCSRCFLSGWTIAGCPATSLRRSGHPSLCSAMVSSR
jgi:fucose permease